MSTSRIEKKKTPRVIRIVLTVFAVLAAVLVIGTAFTVHYIMTDPQIAAAADSTKHLGDQIAYYVDQGKLYAYVDDPGTDSFAFDEERCTEVPEEARSDFGGFTFVTAAGHDEGAGYSVIVRMKEGSAAPADFAVFRLQMKGHRITEVTDARIVEDLKDYEFQ